jgi:hypothetical protein
MRKIVIANVCILIGVLFLNVKPIHAQAGSMMGLDTDQTEAVDESHAESVEAVLQDILNQQNVSTVQELNLVNVGDDEWERLGDAVMELQHPGQAHEVMDSMMGGEGSESLRQMHINMGQAYLGYGSGNRSYGPGMMGRGMMGGGMMGYGAHSGVYGVLGGLTWVALITFLAAGVYFFIKQAGKK